MLPRPESIEAYRQGLLAFPEGHLVNVPLSQRWEAIRRNPFYQTYWKPAQLFRRGEAISHPAGRELGRVAVELLRMFGVVGEPPDPATGFDEMAKGIPTSAYLGGSLRPLTLRQMVGLLVRALPPAERNVVAAVFRGSVDPSDEGDRPLTDAERVDKVLRDLGMVASPIFDAFPDEPLVQLFPTASRRAVERDLVQVLKTWKSRHPESKRRLRTENYSSYFKVWDLREGWEGGGYDRTREQLFPAIARTLRIAESTAVNRHRKAFQLITGHPCTPMNWVLSMGRFHAIRVQVGLGPATGRASRTERESVRLPVPNTRVTAGKVSDRGEGVVERHAEWNDPDIDDTDHRIDTEALRARGWSEEEIQDVLELSSHSLPEKSRGHSRRDRSRPFR